MRLALIATLMVVLPASGQVGPPALELIGPSGVVRSLTETDLAALPARDVTGLEEGAAALYRGPSLRELVSLVGAPTGRGLRGPAMTLAVLVEAADGYVVGFMLSELDAQFGARDAIVASTRNGTRLGEGDGPLRVVVPEDEFHARWVRQVVRVRVVQVAPSPR